MFFSDPDKITLSAVRRIIRNVGPEHIEELINLRICDRIGTGRPKEQPFRLRKYQAMIDEALRDPISVGMLKIDGKRLMEVTGEAPGPKDRLDFACAFRGGIGRPKKNTAEYLEKRAGELVKLPEASCASWARRARTKRPR
jgi:tRNA nucleotidyltransferase (CCA-adding enzyme)